MDIALYTRWVDAVGWIYSLSLWATMGVSMIVIHIALIATSRVTNY